MIDTRLVIISGPPGSGKSTLARTLGREFGWLVISRDEIKEGMTANFPAYVPTPSDTITQRTYDAFFETINLLLNARISHICEAAFSADLWHRHLDSIMHVADIRLVKCDVDPGLGLRRVRDRAASPRTSRRAHVDSMINFTQMSADDLRRYYTTISYDGVQAINLDTTAGYDPPMETVKRFVDGQI
jgi:predicted kinase